MNTDKKLRMLRRTFLGGVGTAAAGALLQPLVAQAQANAAPQRLLMIHRPCGTVMKNWWPSGTGKAWTTTGNISAFEKLRNKMVIMKGVDCPRVQDWLGDKHGAGMLAMTTPSPNDKGGDLHVWPVLPGRSQSEQNDTNAKFFTATDKSIDQLFLEQIPGLKGTRVPSVQLGSSRVSAIPPDNCLRVVSYSKTDPNAPQPTPMYPEVRPASAFTQIFGTAMMGMGADDIKRLQAQNKSVLDYISNGGLTPLRARVPVSERPKIDAHLTAIRALETNLANAGSGRICMPMQPGALPPVADMNNTGLVDDTQHFDVSMQMMNVIKTAFQCDVTRVASFTFGWGNSDIHGAKVLPVARAAGLNVNSFTNGDGHHNISHSGDENAQEIMDRLYCEITAKLLMDMDAIQDGPNPSDTLLDNTLVVFWNECSTGGSHDTVDMPVLLFGAKFLKLQGGQYQQYAKVAAGNAMKPRYMSDFWVTTAQQWGYQGLTSYGAPMWNTGTLAGIYG